MILKKALFLDRDGVINIDTGHLYRFEDVQYVDNILKLHSKYSIDSDNYSVLNWSIDSLKFKNVLLYGNDKNNFIDFFKIIWSCFSS